MRTCEACGGEMPKRYPSQQRKRFCSAACYNQARHKARKNLLVGGQYLRSEPNHPLAPPSGWVAVSRLVLYEKIGPGSHPCHWCGTQVTWKRGVTSGALIADHVDWDKLNDDASNLVPSCNHCNAHRTKAGTRGRLGNEDLTVVWSGVRTRAVQRQCETCGSEFLTIPAQVKIGKGRFCSRSCARQAPRQR